MYNKNTGCSYYSDDDTGLYYCNARYYSPKWRRFISPDDTSYLAPESVNGLNLYCYCNNDPVNLVDPSGHAIETVFDIISLGASIVDVAINPLDPWAWLGLVGDVADVALLGVGGLGEAVRVLKATGAIDDTVDVVKITKNTLEVISTTANALSAGGDFLYVAYGDGAKTILEYVGITNDFNRRKNEWALKREIFKRIEGVDRNTARCAEQTLISLFGKKGNTLSNIRNSIGKNGKLVDEYIAFFKLFI